MATTQTIAFKGTFDTSQILSSLRQIKTAMQNAGASDNLFQNVDKQIKDIENLMKKMQEQVQKGFSNTKEINAFEKDLNNLSKSLQSVTKDFLKINDKNNFSFNSENIEKANAQLTKTKQKLAEIKKQQKSQITKDMISEGYDPTTAKKWAKALVNNQTSEEKLLKILKEEYEIREQNYESAKRLQEETAKQAARDVGSNTVSSLNMSGFTATTGKSGAGKNDWRSRDSSGNLKKKAGQNIISSSGEAAITQAYAKALEDASQDASKAQQIFEAFKQTLTYNGIAIDENIIKFKDFNKAVTEMAVAIRQATEEQQANVDATQTALNELGSRNSNNEIQITGVTIDTDAINNSMNVITEAQREVEQATNDVRDAVNEGTRQGTVAEQNFATSIENVNQTIDQQNDELLDMTQSTREASQAQEELNSNFDNIKNYVKNILSLGSAFTTIKSVIRDTFQSIQELDQNFASIAMVTDYSVADMWESYGQYAQMANELGQQTKDVIASSALFYQQGIFSVLFT